MKIRSNLVSNSSSSSFIIATPKKLTEEELAIRLGATPNSPIFKIVKKSISILTKAKTYTEQEFIEDYCYGSWEELEKDYDYNYPDEIQIAKKAFKKNWIVQQGFIHDDDNSSESILAKIDIHHESNDLVLLIETGR